jgi:hypothetical protein
VYVLRIDDDGVTITLPNEYDVRITITLPHICGHVSPLLGPVYLWRSQDHYYVLNCASGIHRFNKLEELIEWVREQRCTESHKRPIVHWVEWYIVTSNEKWLSSTIIGNPNPPVDEIVSMVKRYL